MWATTAIKVCEWCGRVVEAGKGGEFQAIVPSENDSIMHMQGFIHDAVCSQAFWDHITTLLPF